MMESQKVKHGNSRLIYCEQKVETIDLSDAVSVIDELIHFSAKLQLACNQIVVDFTLAPSDFDFSKSTIYVGREILGYDPEVFSQIKYKDFKNKVVSQTPILLHTDWKQIFEEAQMIVQDSDHWRLTIADDFSKAMIEI